MLPRLNFQNQVNAFGGIVLVIIGGYFACSAVPAPETPPCSRRYPTALQMALQNANGALLAPSELQARAGLNEHGVLEKVRVLPAQDSSSFPVLRVQLDPAAPAHNGIAMTWAPQGLLGADAACLAYQIYLPADFPFGGGGYLPGLSGARRQQGGEPTASDTFAAPVTFDTSGTPGVEAWFSGAADGTRSHAFVAPAGRLAKARWVSIEQEIVLNPANGTGILRLWVDGQLRIEDPTMAWRKSAGEPFTGIAADVGYVTADRPGEAAQKPAHLLLSPLRVSWKK